jgi:hypothetical protein
MTARALIAALGLLLTHAMPVHAGVDRPPQFIVMAFDNCTELERWQELTDFAAEMNRDGDRVHFTFFVSGINFIADGKRNIYEGPHQRRGYSRISFGGSPEQVRRRVDYVNDLYRNGHEIASHAVGISTAPHGRARLGQGVSRVRGHREQCRPQQRARRSRLAFSAAT